VAGDRKYACRDEQKALRDLGLRRMFLHSHFSNCGRGEFRKLTLSAPMTGELRDFLGALGRALRAIQSISRKTQKTQEKSVSKDAPEEMIVEKIFMIEGFSVASLRSLRESLFSHQNSMPRYSLLIFDWDGYPGGFPPATSSLPMQQAIAALNRRPRSDQAIRELIGLGLLDAMQRLFRNWMSTTCCACSANTAVSRRSMAHERRCSPAP